MDWSPSFKATSGLASIVGGLAGALAGDSSTIADAVTGSSAGKNAVENNALVVPILPLALLPNPMKEEADKQLTTALNNALNAMGKTLKFKRHRSVAILCDLG